jgi:hypothetical protein
MGFPLGYGFKGSALRQHLSFTFKVDLCVDVGGVDGDVPHPGANGVDVDARAQEMGSGCMTDGVRADSFPQQRRTLERCFSKSLFTIFSGWIRLRHQVRYMQQVLRGDSSGAWSAESTIRAM